MSRIPKPSQLELEPPVIRNEGDWLREAEHLADMLAVLDGLRDDLSTEVRKRRKEIKAREREVSNTARALREGRGNRKQMDLYPTEAQRALHDVAARADGKKPLPSEAHVFIGKSDNPDKCHSCDKLFADGQHTTRDGKFITSEQSADDRGARPGNGKEPLVSTSKARTRRKGPLARKARARA